MGRAPCCENKEGRLKKGAWTAEEDEKLVSFIHRNNGHGSWRTLPQLAGLQRCGKSCRLRWTNYLRPNIKRGNFTPEEEWTITQLHALLGNKWSSIASRLPGRTDNEVKNHWNTHLKKRLSRMGIDPTTHRPAIVPLVDFNIKNDIKRKDRMHNSSFNCKHQSHRNTLPLLDQSYVSHMAQWELARLEAEGRIRADKASSASSSESLKEPASSACVSKAATESRGQGKENESLEAILGELLEAPSLDTSNNTSSYAAGSQFNMNEIEITSDLNDNSYMSPPSPSSSHYHDPLLALADHSPASPFPPACEATSQYAYWANMLSLVDPFVSSCPC